MKNIFVIIVMIFGMAVMSMSCEDSQTMCDEDIDCLSFCRIYASDLVYVCSSEGSCICLDTEELECDVTETVAEGELTHCEKLCASVKPGSVATCLSTGCVCNEPAVQE